MDGFDGTLGLGGFVAVLAVLGGLLGGAVGHWQRGSGRLVSGAIIGAIALPLAVFLYLYYLGALVVVAIILAILAAVSGLLG